MHILFITEFFPRLHNPVFSGGVEARCFYTATLINPKHQITVIARRKKGERPKESLGNLTVYRLGSPATSSAATISSLFPRFIFLFQSFFFGRSIRANLVEGSNYICFLPAFIIAKYRKIPVISWYPDLLKGQWLRQFGWILGSLGELGESFFVHLHWSKIIAISGAVKDKLLKSGIPQKQIAMIECGVDSNTLNRIKNETQIKKDQLIVVSRLVPYKRVDWTIKALKHLENEYPHLHLLIIGDGPQKQKLIKLAQALKIRSKVSIISKVSQERLYTEMAQSKLLLHPSTLEGFGIVLIEASVLGTPFVAADIPTSVSLERRLKSGSLFAKEQFKEFTDKINYLLCHNNEYQQLEQNGAANSGQYDWKLLTEETVKLYERVAQKNTKTNNSSR